jgi:glycosyltransferase involved in cell wall biosynthesis
MNNKFIRPDENKFKLRERIYNAFQTSFEHYRCGNILKRRFLVRQFYKNVWLLIVQIVRVKPKVTFELTPNARHNILKDSNKPYVLHVICNMEIGGSQKIILDIFERMTSRFKMKILTGHIPFYVNYHDLPITMINTSAEITAYLKAEKPDIIHFHFWGLDAWMKIFLDIALALKEEIGYMIIENSNNPIQAVYHTAIDHYVHVSQFVINIQTEPIQSDKNSVIYPGVDMEEFKFKEFRNDLRTAGMVFRLTNDKINKDTIDLLIKICRKIPDILIYVIGDGPNLKYFIKRSIQASVRNNICFTGFVAYKDLSRYYEKFNVFLAPVHHESYGVVVPYAMFKGNPIVAYNVGAIEELLTKENIIVNDEQSFINSVVDIIHGNLDTTAIILRNRQIAESRFTLNSMIKKYQDLYMRRSAN